MKNIFRIGARIHKKGDGNNRTGKIRNIVDNKADCEFTVGEIIEENQANGRPIEKSIPISEKFTYEYEWVPLNELEYPKDDDD